MFKTMFSVESYELETDENQWSCFHSIELPNRNWEMEKWEVVLRETSHADQIELRFRRVGGSWLVNSLPLKVPPGAWPRQVSPHAMRERVRDCRNLYSSWVRRFYWNERFELRARGERAAFVASIVHNGMGHFNALDGKSYPAYKFDWWGATRIQRPDLTAVGTGELLNLLSTSPNYNYSRRLMQMSEDECWAHSWKWKRGGFSEFKRVLTWMLLAQEELWRAEKLHFTLDLARQDANCGALGSRPNSGEKKSRSRCAGRTSPTSTKTFTF